MEKIRPTNVVSEHDVKSMKTTGAGDVGSALGTGSAGIGH